MTRTHVTTVVFAAGLVAGAVLLFSVAAREPGPLPYLDPDLAFEARARDLVSRMTVEEKVSQLTNQAAAIPRLGVPAYEWWNECLHGVARAGVATVFPQAIGLAATFDEPLLHEMAEVIADEARAKHHQFVRQGKRGRYQGLTFWSPNINIFRDPRWGRGQETYGEDPFLTGRLGVAFVKGLQGDDPRYYEAIATAKHFAVHSGPEPDRHHFDARPTRARPPRDVPPRVPGPRAGGQGGVRDGRLQPRQRRVGLGQPAPAPGHPEEGVGLRRVRGLRLRRHRRHLHAPQAGGDRGRGVGARCHEGLRPRVRQRLPHPGKGPRARPPRGRGPGRGGAPAHARADEARDVRSAGARAVRADPVLRQRRPGARPSRPAGGAGVDRPPEERRRPAAAQGPRKGRRRRSERRRPGHAPRQLQRDALAPGHHPGRDPWRGLARHPRPLRARGRPRRGAAGPARRGGDRAGFPAAGERLVRTWAHRRVLPRARPPGRADAHAAGPEGGLPLGSRRAHGRAGRAG